MPYIGYTFILLVCFGIILVCFDKIKTKVYPFLLFGAGASLVLIASLAGPYLVGSDIHLEYYYAQLRAGGDVIQPIVGTPQGTSIISYLSDNIWVYKVVYPLLLALVPVLLYFVFRKWITEKQAFLASFFFISFPAFSMELPGIVRQMVAEFVLATMLYLVVVSSVRLRYKIPIAIFCSSLLVLTHYAIAMVALVLLGIGCTLGSRKRIVGICLAVIVIAAAIYFPLMENGAVYTKLAHIYNSYALSIKIPGTEIGLPKAPSANLTPPMYISLEMAEHPPIATPLVEMPTISRYGALTLSGLGLDFFETTTTGKMFRVLQWAILLLMIIGVWKLRKNKAYWVFGGGGVLLLLLMLIPGFSNLLNLTRFLHLGLFLLAPLAVVALRPKYLLIILIPYFLFTSGVVFEVTKQDNIQQITIPYSVGLSNYRMDLGASITKDDWEVRQYIYNNKLFPICSDIVGADFVGEMTGWRSDLDVALRRDPIEVKGFHIFIRSRNVKDGTFVVWNGVGCRKYVDPKVYYGIDWNKNIIYQKGEARVIWVD